jgi:signal transduction histidine kinase
MSNHAGLKRERTPNSAKQTLKLIPFLTYELKSRLTSITTSASLLAEELALSLDDPKTKLIGNILTSSRYLEARASELSGLARLQVDSLCLELEKADIDAIVYRVADQLLSIVRSRDQSLTLNLTPNLPNIIGDPLRIQQILHNLLSNATKLTPYGGSISISTHRQGEYIVIEIKDGSTCIPLEEQHEVFLPYYRAKGAEDEPINEIGLGLALCKHLIELHGGNIWVESKENEGNTFAFTLPLSNS